MREIQHFADFIKDTVNLDTTRLDLLEASVETLSAIIRNSDWEPTSQKFVPQGSWAHETIIKPVDGRAFDADLLVLVDPVDGWDAKKYIDELHRVFAGLKTYKDKLVRYSHCVTIAYAGERKVDIAPCVVDRGGVTRMEVCNRSANTFEGSEPEKYTDWLIERNKWTGRNGLRKITRLLKYLRDIKGRFSCKSALLTTLLGARIDASDADNKIDFADLPTALKTIVGRLDDWLDLHPTRPTLTNPVLSSEDLSGSWDDDRYTNFKDQIHRYRTWIDDAYDEKDSEESLGKWRRVFGSKFARGVSIEKAATVSDAARDQLRNSKALSTVSGDLVSMFAQLGAVALPRGFDRLPHKQRPRWRALESQAFDVKISAALFTSQNGTRIRDLDRQNDPLPKHHWIEFRANYTTAGTPLLHGYDVHWRVTNTDREAHSADCLRGKFVAASSVYSHWEQLRFRGVHMVEVFFVRKQDNVLVAHSEPFYVTIG
jgi:hypothetical protein